MSSPDTDKVFSGSIPRLYETYLVPLIFEFYAADLVNRLASRSLTRVLEIAAGTGVVTRSLASVLPERVSIAATDLNQSMLDYASALWTKRPVEWRQADGMQLPFPDGSFDAMVCQFGVMFFSDKSKAFSEARRVLRSGGVFIFNVWSEITTLAKRSLAKSSRIPAIAYCQGTPLRNEIEARDASRLDEATDIAAAAIAQRFGRGAVDGKIQAHIVTIGR